MAIYGVWCKDEKGGKGDWLRELRSNVDDGGIALLAFTSLREAQRRAAKNYGFDSYGGETVRLVRSEAASVTTNKLSLKLSTSRGTVRVPN